MGIDSGARSGRHLRHSGARGPALGLALFLHGGRVSSTEPVSRFQPAALRVAVLAAAVHRQVAGRGVAVDNLRFAVRGWNGAQQSPVADARWALDDLRDRLGLPVVLVGHSMGGRTALRVAGHESVRGVVALAPWLPDGEPMAELAGRDLVILHGQQDRITDPAASARYAERSRSVAAAVSYHDIPGDGHAMLRRARTWNRLTAQAVLDCLRPCGVPER